MVDIEILKDFVKELIGSTVPVGWPGDRVGVYETGGGLQYVVTYTDSFEIKSIGYKGKTIVFDNATVEVR